MIKLKITCREATRIALRAEDRRPPLAERLTLRLHHAGCTNCRRFDRQLRLMRQASERWRRYTGE